MQAIWIQDEAEFHGQHVDFDPIWLWPKPVQKPFPPVLVGGDGPRSLAAAAEYGGGWMPIVSDVGAFKAKLGELHQLCEENGRPNLQVTGYMWEPDEELLACCAELGVGRCILLAPSQDIAARRAFLDSCSPARRRENRSCYQPPSKGDNRKGVSELCSLTALQ